MTRNNDIDFEKMEKLYRLGQLSIREIARQCDTQPSTVTRRAAKCHWTQDLSTIIAQRSTAALLSNTHATPPTREDVDVAVATVVQVVRSHRQDISHGRDIVALLLGQLVDVAQSRDELEGIIDQETFDAKTPQRRAHLMRAIAIPAHAKVISDLSTAMKNLVALERQAFNISDIAAPSAIEEATDDELDRAIAMYAAKAGVKLVAIGEE